jgi:hypothetical protein
MQDARDAAKQGPSWPSSAPVSWEAVPAGSRRQGCRSQQGSLQVRRRSQQRGSAFGRRILSVHALLLPLQLTPAACCASQLHSPVQDVPSGLTWPACRADLQAKSTIVGGKTGISSASNAGTPQREAVCCNPDGEKGLRSQPPSLPTHLAQSAHVGPSASCRKPDRDHSCQASSASTLHHPASAPPPLPAACSGAAFNRQ